MQYSLQLHHLNSKASPRQYFPKKLGLFSKLKNDGIDIVREFRIQLVVTKFENLKMDENVSQYHGKIRDIANKTYPMG